MKPRLIPPNPLRSEADAFGFLVWFVCVVLLYFACKWFAGVKARRRDWWLSYL